MVTKQYVSKPDIYQLLKSDDVDEAVALFNHEWFHGDRVQAGKLAKEFVNDNRSLLSEYLGGRTRVELVDWVTDYRQNNKEESRTITDMWLLSEFAPQSIRGYKA